MADHILKDSRVQIFYNTHIYRSRYNYNIWQEDRPAVHPRPHKHPPSPTGWPSDESVSATSHLGGRVPSRGRGYGAAGSLITLSILSIYDYNENCQVTTFWSKIDRNVVFSHVFQKMLCIINLVPCLSTSTSIFLSITTSTMWTKHRRNNLAVTNFYCHMKLVQQVFLQVFLAAVSSYNTTTINFTNKPVWARNQLTNWEHNESFREKNLENWYSELVHDIKDWKF